MREPGVVILIGDRRDRSVSRIAAAVRRHGFDTIVIDPAIGDVATRLTYRLGATGQVSLAWRDEDQVERRLDAAHAVWWWFKPILLPRARAEDLVTSAGGRFTEREWQHALEPLAELLPAARWVNPRPAERIARHKLIQLHRASRIGFRTPRTVVSNDVDVARDFLRSNSSGTVFKPLSHYVGVDGTFLFTNDIDEGLLADSADNLRVAPGIFQERIPKRFEYRVTVVGRSIFAAEIDSQQVQQTELDWRRGSALVDYRAVELPPPVAALLLRFHASLGLVYGAYDFILTPENEWVFLEVNPVGQWLWLEEHLELPISAALAAVLTAEHR